MRKTLLAAALLASLSACQKSEAPTAAASADTAATAADTAKADAAFADLSKRALEGWLQLSPAGATQIGEHKYDGELDDLSAAGRQKGLEFSKKILAELDATDIAALSRENQVDAAILRNQLQYDIWTAETLQSWAWDPQVYNNVAGGAIYGLMAREFAPLPDRLKSATARMQKIPALLAQARENLDPARVPKVHAETVAKQNAGILSIVDTFITPHLKELPEADRARADAAIDGLKKAVAEHQAWLDKTLVPNAKGDFRIGQALYDQKLQFALLSSLSRADIKQRAEGELKRVREEMYGIARTVLKDKPGAPALPETPTSEEQQKAIEAALELAYAERPARDKVVPDAEAALAQATEFVRKHDLVTLPDAPVEIIEMPEFQRGVAVAYCDSPGPLDKNLKTFYAVSPIPDEWDQKQVDSFLREYNSRMIHLLSIHEGTPGHYLEGWHSAKFPSTLRAVLRSGMFAEGWAVYTEKMMSDAGYLDNDPLFHLVQMKFYLRTIANAILDQGVQVDGWTREQAMDLMVRQTFQQEREAAGKWTRAQLTSAQLPTYFVGVQEHFDMRKAAEAKQGAQFNLKAYHDQVLSYGAPPVRFVRQLMLDEPIK
ncbi:MULTISPECIES: DUF885 domain-containing protein [unclassified Pseudoxanthomonas]|uniref:DUF885 domain-containing protein n=1 Tax=unclassified Pseudoxanthomonas TaxID=2645906 RepID=UPI0008E53494|nr:MULTISPECIES: DUF885 domain-containing protein [unclassified Pseudoxanthomonas]PPJ42124.1 DUF885 domain-containing protein [Pseudoxanthomonas sp. KAs_5_3]SFV28465.1 Uncharacterized conserved protein, DUF885 familyt [Pseudoxanthomonas sp. YR558]